MRAGRIATLCCIATLIAAAAGGGLAQQRNIHFELITAARGGDRGAAAALLDQGASPNARNRLGDTPLNSAAARGQLELVQLLLAHQADVNLANLAR